MNRDVVERAKRGDADAFETLARNALPGCYAVCLAITGRHEDAMDATQEALIRAWRQLPTLRDTARAEPWLRAIAANAARDIVRARSRVRAVPIELAAEVADPTPGPAVSSLDVAGAVDGLPPHLRDAAERHYLRDQPISDVSVGLGIPRGTVKSRLHAARGFLRERLGAERR